MALSSWMMDHSWWLGVILSLLACLATVCGILVQKHSHLAEQRKPQAEQRPVWKRCHWWLSLLLLILVPAPLVVAAFAFASQSLLAPLSAVTLLLNVVMAPCFLKERLHRIDLIATGCVFFGAGLTTAFGAHVQTSFSEAQLLKRYSSGHMLAFEGSATAILLGLMVFSFLCRTPIGTPPEELTRAQKLLPFAYGAVAGLAGAQQSTFTKAVSEVLFQSFYEESATFWSWFDVVLIAFGVTFALIQVMYVNYGLEYFDAVFFMPIYSAILIVFTVVCGDVFFAENRQPSLESAVLFPVGALICVLGVLLLAYRSSSPEVCVQNCRGCRRLWQRCKSSKGSCCRPKSEDGELTPLLPKAAT